MQTAPQDFPAHDFPACDYHAVRWRWCRGAVLALLKRWAVFLLVVGAVIGARPDYVLGALAWVVLPLLQAAARGALTGLLAMLVYALAGGLLLWALQPLLLPRHWFAAERALPLPPGTLRRSDMRVAAWALLPVAVVDVVSCGVWLGSNPPWLTPARGLAIALVLGAVGLAWLLGVAAMQGARRPLAARQVSFTERPGRARRIRPLPWWFALWLLAMWRGPARQLAVVMAAGGAALAACVAGLVCLPGWASWFLAGFAAVALLLTTRARALQLQLWPHWAPAFAALPVSRRRQRGVEQLLAMGPVLLAFVPLAAALASSAQAARPAVAACYLAACLLGPWWQASQGPVKPQGDPTNRAAHWFITLVVMLALASEVLPAA